MPAAVVRADYEQLTRSAADFGQQAADLRQRLQQLRQQADVLQGGDWLGQGAQAFYAEMNGQVLPSLNRLVRALDAAAGVTQQVRQIAEQAEAEAAACLRLAGAPLAAVGPGPNVSAFVGGFADPNGSGGGGSGSGSGSNRPGPAGGTKTKRPTSNAWTDTDRVLEPLREVNPKLAEAVENNPALLKRLIGLSRSTYFIIDGPPAKAGADVKKGFIIVSPTTTLAELTRYAATAYEHPRILHELDPKLVAELKKDPVLFQRLRQLDEADWNTRIQAGTVADLTMYDRTVRTVTIAPNNQVDSIRRGVAMAERAGFDDVRPAVNMRSEDYVRLNVDQEFRRDASQILLTLRAEQAAVGRMSTRLPTMQPTANVAAYHKIAKDFADGKLKQWQAVRDMVDLMRTEPRGVTSASLADTYYAERWNEFVDSLQKSPGATQKP